MIDRFLPAVADRASAILVGHGHYDHLLDVPYIATHRATSAFIYGGPSIRRMLMGDSILRRHGGRRLVPIEPATAEVPRGVEIGSTRQTVRIVSWHWSPATHQCFTSSAAVIVSRRAL
ncbi:MAG: hypothetical protein ACJ792_04730 [Gemmatimonadaceae bacterium]